MLLSRCKETVASNTKAVSGETTQISSDFDAFSATVTVETDDGHLDENTANGILSLLQVFGTKHSNISLPYNAVGAKKKDSIFGCPGGEGCQHLKEFKQNEMLVISTPVKIATHTCCKTKLIEFFHQHDWNVEPSQHKDICFDPKIASNLPSFDLLMEAVLTQCFVGTKFFIHIADFGMRRQIKDSDYGERI